MKLPINPTKASFPIFWFPLGAPLFLSALGIFGDLLGTPIATSNSFQIFSYFCLSGLKNIHLAYASIDIWALTEFTTAAATERLKGWQVWSYILAATIGLLFHMFSYLVIALLGSSTFGIWLGIVLFLIGTYGVLQIRGVVFMRIEIKDLNEME